MIKVINKPITVKVDHKKNQVKENKQSNQNIKIHGPKKIAVILKGLAHLNNYYNNHTQKYFNVDYKKSLENYKTNLFSNHDVDIFFHTYDTPDLDENQLVEDLHPKAYDITPMIHNSTSTDFGNRSVSLLNTIRKAFTVFDNYMEENPDKEYDYIVVTRFDLLFKLNVWDLNIHPDKFNISCMCEVDNLCDDNLYIFHPKYFKLIKQAYDSFDIKRFILHTIYKDFVDLIGINNINIMIQGKYAICLGTPIYSIIRE